MKLIKHNIKMIKISIKNNDETTDIDVCIRGIVDKNNFTDSAWIETLPEDSVNEKIVEIINSKKEYDIYLKGDIFESDVLEIANLDDEFSWYGGRH